MGFKRILGIVILASGIALILFSNYIRTQVGEGKNKIASAQQQVDRGNSLFSLYPAAQKFGQVVTGSAQKKIDEGKQQVGKYDSLAGSLQIWGIALVILGIGVILLGGKKRKDHR